MSVVAYNSNCTVSIYREVEDKITPTNELNEPIYDDTQPYQNPKPIPGLLIYKKASMAFDKEGTRIMYDELLCMDVDNPLQVSDLIQINGLTDGVLRRVTGVMAKTDMLGNIDHYEYYLITQP